MLLDPQIPRDITKDMILQFLMVQLCLSVGFFYEKIHYAFIFWQINELW